MVSYTIHYQSIQLDSTNRKAVNALHRRLFIIGYWFLTLGFEP
ncbi:hypothetical protein SOHN41_00837 [Shewanella sp. HN-41]|nr:hypothetical protein SOHN41_00837 [Shewanella sp. HN-41]